jgi:regulator of cell morphogenesis and NO signaling
MATTTQTVRDIAMENPAAVRVFERYGIEYCCGGKVEPLADLAAYIVGKHHAYVNQEMPRLNQLAAKVVNRHGDTRAELHQIQAKVAELAEEMAAHQGKEEVVLFPYIGKLEHFAAGSGPMPRNCFGSITHPIAMMTQDHDAAGALMADVRRLSHDYTVPEGACPTFRAFYTGLQEFEQDLHRHIALENNILFPRAIALEHSLAK